MGYYMAGGALTDALVATLKPLTAESPFPGGGTGPVQALAKDAISALQSTPSGGGKNEIRAHAKTFGDSLTDKTLDFPSGSGGRRGRRMNPGNVRALRRGMRRIQSFAKLAQKTIQFTHRTKMRKGRRR